MMRSKLNKDYEKKLIDRINKINEEGSPLANVPGTHFNLYLNATLLNDLNYLEFMLISPIVFKFIHKWDVKSI